MPLDVLQMLIVLAILLLLVRPVGTYMAAVFARKPSAVDRVFDPIDNSIYRLSGVNPNENQRWPAYVKAMLITNLVMWAILFIILEVQQVLPLNPDGQGPVNPWLAFNTSLSFITNTNWQNYGGENTLSYFSQLFAIIFPQFTSAATGLACGIAFIRGLGGSVSLGNFYVDLTRAITRIMLPISFVAALAFVALGVPATFDGALTVNTLNGALTPPAAAAAPTADQSTAPTPVPTPSATSQGQQVITRGPVAALTMFVTSTTAFTTGTINAMHDSLTPLASVTPLSQMLLNMVFGGKGVGFINLVIFAILGVFLTGLMVGRTPEFLGKKIESYEVKLAASAFLIHPMLILFFMAATFALSLDLASINNPSSHGFSEVLYAYTSTAANNGSAFAGLSGNTNWWNASLGIVVTLGRYVSIVLMLALAGSMAAKKEVPMTVGTMKTDGRLFGGVLAGTVLIIGALTFFPVLALGPLAEHFAMWAGQTFS
jgi:K+-transporting ATPase A subunit